MTTTRTRRLDVNAAFLQDIKNDNQHLKELFDRLSGVVNHPVTATNHLTEIIDLLGELRDQLAFHFSLEEAYGYFDSALESDSLRSAQAESLRSEHSTLFAMIRDLADQSAACTSAVDGQVERLLRRYDEFFRIFAAHEEAEIRLILSALDDGIGEGD